MIIAASVPGMTLDQMAEELWNDQQASKPSWDQLGYVTRSVWLEKAFDGVVPEGRQPLNPIPRNSEGRMI